MKKSIALIICCLMLVTCSLAGCSSFSVNYVAYYNAVVATVGDTKITRFDLLNAYSSYGYSYYVSTYGYETDEALSMTLDLLIDREVLYQYALDNTDKYGLEAYQVNAIIEELFDSVDEQMEDYISEAIAIINPSLSKAEADEEEDEDNETAYLYSDYVVTDDNRRAILVEDGNGGYKIQYISTTDTSYTAVIDKTYLENYTQNGTIDAIVEAYFAQFRADLELDYGSNADAIYTKVRSLLAEDLISYEYYLRDENGNKYSTKTTDLIYRYFERNFESQIKSEYLENIRIYFLEHEDLSIDELIEAYKYLVEVDYSKYTNHESSYISTMTDIGTDGDSVLYHNTNLSDNTEFGYFIHVLISFTDEQTEALNAIESTEGTDSAKYKSLYNSIVLGNLSQVDPTCSDVVIYARDSETGLVDETETGTGYSISQIIEQYNAIANSTESYATKLEKFIQFMFKYTGDTATLTSGMPYVVGTNDNSAMEDAFTEEALNLMKTGVAGTMTAAINLSDENFDASSSLCITSYGIHFLFYVGNVDAYDVPYSEHEAVYIALENKANDYVGLNLYTKEINPLTHETYFDYLFDIVYPENSTDGETYTSNTGYSNYETNLINEAKNTYKVVTNSEKLKSTNV